MAHVGQKDRLGAIGGFGGIFGFFQISGAFLYQFFEMLAVPIKLFFNPFPFADVAVNASQAQWFSVLIPFDDLAAGFKPAPFAIPFFTAVFQYPRAACLLNLLIHLHDRGEIVGVNAIKVVVLLALEVFWRVAQHPRVGIIKHFLAGGNVEVKPALL